jgi:NADH dehydrogenase
MDAKTTDAVTGAFGYTGRAIAERLLGSGRSVRTLTGHPRADDPLAGRLDVAPLDFDRPARLAASLAGVDTLYNTYWVRFNRGSVSFDRAVVESAALFTAARTAGVRRIVHVSITNADEASPLPYFRGKGRVERALRESGVSYAIVRPTVIVGDRDILVHDIAWCVRHLPVFGVAGDGRYRIQPVMVEDVARIAAEAGRRTEDMTIDAVGPDVFTFDELVRLIAAIVRGRARIVHLPRAAVLAGAAVLGALVGDVVLTPEELDGLMASLLVSEAPPTGQLHVEDWLRANHAAVGHSYANELRRHFTRP